MFEQAKIYWNVLLLWKKKRFRKSGIFCKCMYHAMLEIHVHATTSAQAAPTFTDVYIVLLSQTKHARHERVLRAAIDVAAPLKNTGHRKDRRRRDLALVALDWTQQVLGRVVQTLAHIAEPDRANKCSSVKMVHNQANATCTLQQHAISHYKVPATACELHAPLLQHVLHSAVLYKQWTFLVVDLVIYRCLPLSIGSPQQNDLVKVILSLEVTDVVADVLHVLPFRPSHYVIRAIWLVGSDEVRIVNRRARLEPLHVGPKLCLQFDVEHFGTLHGVRQVHGRYIPAWKTNRDQL